MTHVAMDTVLECGLKRIQFAVISLYSRLERRKRGQSHSVECMVDAVHCADLARRRSGLLSDMNYQKNSFESGLAFSCGEMGSSSGFILRYWHTNDYSRLEDSFGTRKSFS
jgi:hypothetical protein